jgi:excisionase family DNA binding protein
MDSIDAQIRKTIREEVERAIAALPKPAAPLPWDDHPDRHYSIATVAELLEVSTSWVYSRIASGELRVVELGDSKAKQRIAASTLRAYLAGRSYGG